MQNCIRIIIIIIIQLLLLYYSGCAMYQIWVAAQQSSQFVCCGNNFTLEHAMTCRKGGYPIIRHNEVRDLTANLL